MWRSDVGRPGSLEPVRPLLCIRHEPSDTLGVARGAFEEEGVPIRILDAWGKDPLPGPEEVGGYLVMGGAMNVDQIDRHPYLAEERRLLRQVIEAGNPIMGVCLGAQLIARALDQPVTRAPQRKCGFFPVFPTAEGARDPVVSAFASGDIEFHWNEDTFELPPRATLLASGPDGAIEAYRIGEWAWGIAFHPEVDGPELIGWIEQAGSALEPVWGRSPEDLRREAAERLPQHEKRGRELFRRFARVVLAASAQ
jgi:GMP synthase (glutamine-hydrolysing)